MEVLDDHEAIFNSYHSALYYVQSPSAHSLTNSASEISANNNINGNTLLHPRNQDEVEAACLTLSRYSSSHGSNNSFLHEKKIIYDLQNQSVISNADDHVIGHVVEKRRLTIRDFIVDDHDSDDHDDEMFYGRIGVLWWWWWWRRYFSYRSSSSCGWISLQICWRLFFSLCVALFVFSLVTKPPPPVFSIKVGGIPRFGLGEGVDATGIPTKILNCNFTIDVVINNFSKLFGLHISPPFIQLSFAHPPFAISHGPKLYAKCYNSTMFELYVGTSNTPMYGAGSSMEDMLESGQGLPLTIQVTMRSSYRVVWKIIKHKFHHQAKCRVFLNNPYDEKHATQSFNSTCVITS